jgi:hypothetical protein
MYLLNHTDPTYVKWLSQQPPTTVASMSNWSTAILLLTLAFLVLGAVYTVAERD